MTGFSAQWLALREPADHRARNTGLLTQVLQYFAGTQPGLGASSEFPFRITDLGCGSGSNLRALAASFPEYQQWTLIDYDAELLKAAKETLQAWADHTEKEAADTPSLAKLKLFKNGKQLEVSFVQEDLAKNIEDVLAKTTDLITAAAFFDLVSSDWLVRFCQSLHTPLYTVLTYDGKEKWLPEHYADEMVLDAFHAHQAGDKGFGLSAGPAAIGVLQAQLTARGFDVQLGESPWQLGPQDQELMRALASGSASAVAETTKVAATALTDWLTSRLKAHHCEIGHWDIFAKPC